jgi:hypothetical protein
MHDFQVKVVPGRVCLACHHCGKRSGGWEMGPPMGLRARASVRTEPRTPVPEPVRMARVLHHAPRTQQHQQRA